MDIKNITNFYKRFIWVEILVSLILIFLHWYTGNLALYFLGAGILLYTFLKAPNIIGFIMLFALFPVENMTRLDNGPFSLVTIIIVILFIKLLFNSNFRIDFFILIIASAILFILMLSTLFYSRLFDLDNLRFIVNIFYITSLIIMYKKEIFDYSIQITKYYILGSSLLLIFSVIYSIKIMNIDLFINRLYGLREDPNYIAVIFSIAISLCIINIYTKSFNPLTANMLIIFFIIGIFLTQSRGGIISLVPNLLLVTLLLFRIDKKQILPYIVFFIIFGFILNTNKSLLHLLVDNLSGRINSIDSDGGSHRLEIWVAYLNLYSNNLDQLLFGPKSGVMINGNIPVTVAHNLFLGTIAKSGGINMLLIATTLVYVAISIFRLASSKTSKIGLLPIVTMGLGYFFLDAAFINIFIYVFILSIMISKSAQIRRKII